MRNLFAVVAIFMFAGFSLAQPSAAPTFKVVASVDKERGHITYVHTVMQYVMVQKQVFELVNGQQVAKLVTDKVAVMETRQVVQSLADSRVITPNGKQLALDEVMTRLKVNDVVAIAADSSTPAQVFLQALNSETLVIIPAAPMPVKK